MIKFIPTMILLCLTISVSAQEISEDEKVKKTIETFFQGFHARDSVVMKSVFHEDPIVQTIGRTKEGEVKLVNEELGKVLKGIVAIPLETEFKEVLHNYEIKIDGEMAHAWTPYSFYMNGNFSHCGVNSFQLLKVKEEWKIIFLIDTRRKEGCEGRKMK
ncbi:nuclear transport factor 2 family protein [Salinimicrobium flavum]|uniref:Nuclear transport factor 2 family protein n=1 Tax=Salinimicrobium flavum TaxID=1737065 RepID=A0ABW5IXS9_9FLAO